MKKIRSLFGLLILLGLLQGWWFLILPVGLFGAWAWPLYVEIILAGFVYDSLYGFAPSIGLWGYLGTLVSLSIVILTAGLKMVVRK
ncbi:MAG: hypothetical protein QOG91_368 [Candidatus Parcubacteria bacterium]|jgi:hypothetical protein|nr:hypothetical protein [Candidatus Parcubacteria bacterium]